MSNSSSLKFRFRLLVFLSVVLYVGWFFFAHIESRFYTPEVFDLMTWSGYGAVFDWDVLGYISYALLFAYGVVSLGLIYFKPWSRECFLLLTVIGLLLVFVFGVNVYTEASSFYIQLMYLIDGFIIAMVYFSPLKDEFEITHNKRMQTDAAAPRR